MMNEMEYAAVGAAVPQLFFGTAAKVPFWGAALVPRLRKRTSAAGSPPPFGNPPPLAVTPAIGVWMRARRRSAAVHTEKNANEIKNCGMGECSCGGGYIGWWSPAAVRVVVGLRPTPPRFARGASDHGTAAGSPVVAVTAEGVCRG